MLRNPISASRRAYSSPGSDPLNSVEQGRQAGLTDLPKARQPLLLRYWLRRSNSTPDEISGGPHKIDLTGKQPNPLPSQGMLYQLDLGNPVLMCNRTLERISYRMRQYSAAVHFQSITLSRRIDRGSSCQLPIRLCPVQQ